jgi:hypothetical protein
MRAIVSRPLARAFRRQTSARLQEIVGGPCDGVDMTEKYCPACRAVRLVEQPPCVDGHADCPEWACIECGAAIVVGWFDADAPAVRTASRTHAAA